MEDGGWRMEEGEDGRPREEGRWRMEEGERIVEGNFEC
jgi:hypothetical protein